MFFFLLVVSLTSFLHDFQVSCCDQNCADKPEFSPSRLIVKHGDPAFAKCSVCREACRGNLFKLEIPVGRQAENETTILWTVDSLTQWTLKPSCYYNDANDNQCCTYLSVTVYKPPDNVSISFSDRSGPMFQGRQYTLQCEVQDVAPAANLVVTFYKGRRALDQQQSSKTETKPVTEVFTLSINASEEDDGAQFSCDAKVELGPEGPQPPPVVKSQNIPITVHYKPRLERLSHTDPITVTEGNPLLLDCLAVGNPSPSYNWTLPFNSTFPSSRPILKISSVTPENQGQYTCLVSNKMGSIKMTFNVVVKGLELTTTKLPPTTTTSATTTSTTSTTTTTTTTTATTTTTKTATVPNSSTSNTLIHRFIMCFMLLFSVVV